MINLCLKEYTFLFTVNHILCLQRFLLYADFTHIFLKLKNFRDHVFFRDILRRFILEDDYKADFFCGIKFLGFSPVLSKSAKFNPNYFKQRIAVTLHFLMLGFKRHHFCARKVPSTKSKTNIQFFNQ